MNEVFFLVWNPQGRAPTVMHERQEVAVNEAERLAALNPGQKFFVLEANSVSESKTVTTRKLEYALPF